MGFVPIVGIGPVAMANQTERPDLAGVIPVELRKERREDKGAAEQKASRGLEEDDAEDASLVAEEGSPDAASGGPTINIFA